MSPADASESAEAIAADNRATMAHMRRMHRWRRHRRTEDAMFAVIFLVEPKTERWNDYLDLAKFLKPKLEAVDGFIDNERFASLRTRGRLLSLSTWRDEKAVVRWRTCGEHHDVQEKGRFEIFSDYRLRVGEITHDTQPPAGMTIAESRRDETEVADAKVATITELTSEAGSDSAATADTLPGRLALDDQRDGLVDIEAFESIYSRGKLLLLGLWRNADAANAWKPAHPTGAGTLRHRQVRIIRDYGMFDRREAPQYYAAVDPAHHRAAE
jgi:heme-degrading monooxygenase HmoA